MSSDRAVTIKDVAREAGVSAATVSMALRGSGRISTSRREMLSALADSMGYRRNPAFAALGAMSHRHAASRDGLPVAFIHQLEPNGENRRNELLMVGIEKTCRRLGYQLEEHLITDHTQARKLAKSFYARNVSGVLLGNITDPTMLDALPITRLAFVAAGVYRTLLPLHTVRGSRFLAAEQTLVHLTALGYRKILVFVVWHRPEPLEEDFMRYGGIVAAIKRTGALRRGWIKLIDRPDIEPANQSVWQRIIRREKPDVVVGFNSGDIHQVWPGGSRKPGSPAFAAIEVMDIHKPVVSGMLEHDVEIGSASVEWLDQLIRLAQFGFPAVPRSLLVEPLWNPGSTASLVPPRPAPGSPAA